MHQYVFFFHCLSTSSDPPVSCARSWQLDMQFDHPEMSQSRWGATSHHSRISWYQLHKDDEARSRYIKIMKANGHGNAPGALLNRWLGQILALEGTSSQAVLLTKWWNMKSRGYHGFPVPSGAAKPVEMCVSVWSLSILSVNPCQPHLMSSCLSWFPPEATSQCLPRQFKAAHSWKQLQLLCCQFDCAAEHGRNPTKKPQTHLCAMIYGSCRAKILKNGKRWILFKEWTTET